jgi:hypothetical protein
MGLPHKIEKYSSIFCWLDRDFVCLFSPTVNNSSNWDYAALTSICVVFNFLIAPGYYRVDGRSSIPGTGKVFSL